MRTVILRLSRSADFSTAIGKIKSWLDANGCSSFRFKCHPHSDTVLVKIEFSKDAEADAFKWRFDVNETNANATNQRLREKMEQVCWWRLMAEEIRAQADGFASQAGKETMAQVAMCYDRMADDLEKRLANSRYCYGLFVG